MMSFLHRFIYAITYPVRAVLYSPSKLFAPLRWLVGLSLPVKAAMFCFVFLIICVISIFVLKLSAPDLGPPEFFTTILFCISILVVVIPIVVYFTLKLWLEGEVSPFPDIDHAWEAGIAELGRQGLDPMQIPMFLILGSAGENRERSLFAASRLEFNLAEVPKGPNALHWYANPEGIYLVCTQAGRLSKLCTAARMTAEVKYSAPNTSHTGSPSAISKTIVADDSFPIPAAQPPDADSGPPPDAPSGNIRGTMEIFPEAAFPKPAAPSGEPASEKRPVKLDPREAIVEDRRLEYLCRLIRRRRQPLCPINGVLTLLPFGFIQRSRPDANEVQRAVKADLSTLLDAVRLRCPVTALVVDMEEEEGFKELARRVGRERSLGQRIGKGYSVSNPPLPERLRALCDHACGSFEDWVYALFREPDSLSKTGNTKLFSLLVKVRSSVQSRLEDILAEGFGVREAKGRDAKGRPSDGLLFGGCYFAATGETEDCQAFVKGVFDKLPEQEEDIQWTEAMLHNEERLQHTAQFVMAYCILLLAALLVMLALQWFPLGA